MAMATLARKKKGGSKPGERRGGRDGGTPNKRSVEFLKGLLASGCNPTEEIAALLQNSTIDDRIKLEMWTVLLPYCYPKYKDIDPDGYLTVEQAAGMVGATVNKLKQALARHVPDPVVLATILDEVRPHANGTGG